MKHKTLMTTLLLSFMAAPLFISCGEKEHNFSTKWESDENYHWHVCLTDGHKDTSEKEKHVWDSGKVTKEPTKTETGIMEYVCSTCLREKTEIIEKLKVETIYTITFDSRGGSEVKSITAEAGAKIEAPAAPTKEGYIFGGWYESSDNGTTLSETPFEFTYRPARVFTLYAKWGEESVKGKTYNHTSTNLNWTGTEEQKKAFLAEMEMTEEQYKEINQALTIRFVFDKTEEKASASFGMEPELFNCTVLYTITGNTIIFFDNEEDMKNGIPAHDYGFFTSATAAFSPDRSNLIFTAVTTGLTMEHILTVVTE